ncbi:hypothetical protein KUTeg_004903 [Tegillarca granosa]|uniref:Uncharacterized protein n=1 Tax=Tegillarca granosa TaxID=220873 RepID=A0ABQ9FI86_TEGGR|nr:hypothetical protein KUTeg_004903 [Tegillarca granosa]
MCLQSIRSMATSFGGHSQRWKLKTLKRLPHKYKESKQVTSQTICNNLTKSGKTTPPEPFRAKLHPIN